MDMFDKHGDLLSRLTERPFVRAYVMGLRLRWEQFKEPPPQPPPQVVAEASKRTAADEEEAWFNQSDDEADADGESTVSHVPVKRKRAKQSGPSPKRLSAGGGSALGLDYDDASDSDGSAGAESPKSRLSVPAPETDSELAEGLSDVERKIRAKRIRNEEEEEGSVFTELMTGGKGAVAQKDASGAALPVKLVHDEAAPAEGGAGKEKKIKLSLGSLGRKFRGGKV